MISNFKRIFNTTQQSYSFICDKHEFATTTVTCQKCLILFSFYKSDLIYSEYLSAEMTRNSMLAFMSLPTSQDNMKFLVFYTAWDIPFYLLFSSPWWLLVGTLTRSTWFLEGEWLSTSHHFPQQPHPTPHSLSVLCDGCASSQLGGLCIFVLFAPNTEQPIFFAWSTSHPLDLSFNSSLLIRNCKPQWGAISRPHI